MSIKTSTILVGGTSSSTGGTSTPLIMKSSGLNGESKAILDDGSEFMDSTFLTFTTKDPVVNGGAPNGYTQQRSGIKVVVPLDLANGNHTTNTVSIAIAFDPETTESQVAALLEMGAQLFISAALDAFWKKQSHES
jgi:hypothetical protein